jgi:hypothetical protein
MAKTLPEKLFIKPGMSVAVLHAPKHYLSDVLIGLPEDVAVSETLDGRFDQIQCFVTEKATLLADIETVKAGLKEGGMLWYCYPKGGDKAAIPTDLNRDLLWEALKPHGVAPNHQIAVDETWSALRFKVVG